MHTHLIKFLKTKYRMGKNTSKCVHTQISLPWWQSILIQLISLSEMHAECLMCCFKPVLSSIEIDRIFFLNQTSVKHIYIIMYYIPCRCSLGRLVTIIFVDILKVGGRDKTNWQKRYGSIFEKSVWINGFALVMKVRLTELLHV